MACRTGRKELCFNFPCGRELKFLTLFSRCQPTLLRSGNAACSAFPNSQCVPSRLPCFPSIHRCRVDPWAC